MEGVQNAIDAFNAPRPAPTCARPRTCSRTGPSRSTSTTRARRCSTWRTSTSATDSRRLDDPARQRPVLRRPRPLQGRDAERVLPPQQGRPAADGAAVRHVATRRSATRVRPSGSTSTVPTTRRSRRIRATPHWYGSYKSQTDTILNVDSAVAGGRRSTSGPGTSSRRATTTASSRPWSAATGSPSRCSRRQRHGRHDRRRTRTATTPRATASPARRAATYFVDDPAYIHLHRRACRPARPTSGSATRPTRRTSTPAGSSTTSGQRRGRPR